MPDHLAPNALVNGFELHGLGWVGNKAFGNKDFRSGQCVSPLKLGVGPRGLPQSRNLREPRLGIHSTRSDPRSYAAVLAPAHRQGEYVFVIALASLAGSIGLGGRRIYPPHHRPRTRISIRAG